VRSSFGDSGEIFPVMKKQVQSLAPQCFRIFLGYSAHRISKLPLNIDTAWPWNRDHKCETVKIPLTVGME
jgi:hypothetical protein